MGVLILDPDEDPEKTGNLRPLPLRHVRWFLRETETTKRNTTVKGNRKTSCNHRESFGGVKQQ